MLQAVPDRLKSSKTVTPLMLVLNKRGGSRTSHRMTPVPSHQLVTATSTASATGERRSSINITKRVHQVGCTRMSCGNARCLTGTKKRRVKVATA